MFNYRRTGIISWFRADKGYGFIKPDDDSKDVFLHLKELKKIGLNDIDTGQRLSFDIRKKKNKLSAFNIKLV
ncbi:MAG: cold shock domain-containing protein [Proteobacteria bacterium]|nr:cold shock domain-containing protein [Pseudomonadota bacterium]